MIPVYRRVPLLYRLIQPHVFDRADRPIHGLVVANRNIGINVIHHVLSNAVNEAIRNLRGFGGGADVLAGACLVVGLLWNFHITGRRFTAFNSAIPFNHSFDIGYGIAATYSNRVPYIRIAAWINVVGQFRLLRLKNHTFFPGYNHTIIAKCL